MITDLNNPISNEYRNHAISSFNSVKDIIDIEPYQCYPPKNPSKQIRFNPSKKRSPTEIAILETYYSLFKKIANGEKFIIMEHDAYLRGDREEIFRNLLSELDSFDVWNVGIAVECHTLKQEYAQQFCDNLEDDFGGSFKGPMSLMRKLNKLQSVVYVKDGQTGELCKEAMVFAKDLLNENGYFISKIFMGGTFNEIVAEGKKYFKEVKVFKPKSSRKDSKESFIICKKLR